MSTISEFLTDDHRHCDHILSDAENAVAAGTWPKASELFLQFHAAMDHHLRMEEEVLFPSLEVHTGGPIGPTMVMRHEHAQMRELLQELSEATKKSDKQAFLGSSETLMMLIQQHNMKEEQILYTMADRMLEDELDTVMSQMKSVPNANHPR